MKLVHWYDQTPAELFARHEIVNDAQHATLRLEYTPFDVERQLLAGFDAGNGTKFHYQLALSDAARNHEVQALRAAYPDVARSGERDMRSGIIVFEGPKIVGSFVLTGHSPTMPYMRLVVAPEYRSKGLATQMLVAWGSRFVRQLDRERPQPIVITTTTARVLLAAHAEIVAAEPDIVPPAVLDAVVKGDQARAILKAAKR